MALKKLPPMLQKMGAELRKGLDLADQAHQILIRMGGDHPEDAKIHAAVNKALKDAGLEMYDAELRWDAPRYDDSLDEIVGTRAMFRLCIRGIEDGDWNKLVRALRPLKLGKPLGHAKPDAIEYEVALNG